MPQYTPTERRMLAVLSDGRPHTTEELMACLYDELSERSAVKAMVFKLRRKLRAIGHDIVNTQPKGFRHPYHYQHVILFRDDSND